MPHVEGDHYVYCYFSAAIIAGIIQTVTGFGAAVLLMLVMPHFFDMVAAPAVTSAITVGLSLTLAWKFRKHIKLNACLFPAVIYLLFSTASISIAKKLNLESLSSCIQYLSDPPGDLLLCFFGKDHPAGKPKNRCRMCHDLRDNIRLLGDRRPVDGHLFHLRYRG